MILNSMNEEFLDIVFKILLVHSSTNYFEVNNTVVLILKVKFRVLVL